jgi:peptidoglycan hydrolase-like protein with peptidoglycan-binding domain
MVDKIGGGSSTPPPSTPTKTDETTNVATTNKAQQTQEAPKDTAKADTQTSTQTQTLNAEGRGARMAEKSIEGQARQAQIESQAAPAGTGTGTGTPATGGPPATGSGTPPTITSPTGGAAPTTPAAPKLLKEGSKGPEVENLQNQLNDWRAGQGKTPIGVDQKYGNETKTAVKDFQKANGLTDDGQAGARTQDRLKLETDPNFKSLKPEAQQQIRDQMGKYSEQKAGQKDSPENQSSRTNLVNVATDPNFAKLSPEGQKAALDRLATNPTDAAHTQAVKDTVKDRSTLENDANFKKLNADTQKQALENLEKNHGNQAAKDNIIKLGTDPNFGQLSRTHQDKILQAQAKKPEDAAYTQSLRDITGSPNFRGMDDANKTKVIDMASSAKASPTYLSNLDQMIKHDRFGSMSTQDQKRMLNVFDTTSPKGQEALQKLMSRDVNGQPALTSRGYGSTGTLLEQLDRAASTPLDSRMTGTTKERFTENLLNEVSDPNYYVDQSNHDTCTVTSMSHNLASKNPAEYARIATDLATTGQTKLANGDTMTAPADSFAQDTSTRSDSERLMQSALMNYARPGKGYTNTPAPGQFSDGQTGLVYDQQERVLEGLHNRNYTHYTGSLNFKDDKQDILEKTQAQLKDGKGPVHTRFAWQGGGHAVEVTEVRDGRVYFRNPWGGDQPGISTDVGPNGTTQTNPNVRTDDARNGIQSMTIEEYKKHVNGVIVPD